MDICSAQSANLSPVEEMEKFEMEVGEGPNVYQHDLENAKNANSGVVGIQGRSNALSKSLFLTTFFWKQTNSADGEAFFFS